MEGADARRRGSALGVGFVLMLAVAGACGRTAPTARHAVRPPVGRVAAYLDPRSASDGTVVHAASVPAPQPAMVPADAGPAPVATDPPIRLDIPAIGVNAAVQAVGVLASGHLGVPSNWTDVAWYRGGPAPGQPGDAVIDGHLDSYTAPAVFWKLASLRAGDVIHVQRSTGPPLDFTVDSLRQIPYQSHDLGGIFSTQGPPSLTLITCGGPWLAAQRVYAERLVVHAELTSPDTGTPAAR